MVISLANPQNIRETTTEPHLVRVGVRVRVGFRIRVGFRVRV